MDILINASIGISSGVVAAAVYDVLKKVFVKKGKPHEHIKYTQLKQPDGTELVIFDKEEA